MNILKMLIYGTSFPDKFNDLARYNDEVYHGILHTEEYKERMRKLQLEYNKKIKHEHPNIPRNELL